MRNAHAVISTSRGIPSPGHIGNSGLVNVNGLASRTETTTIAGRLHPKRELLMALRAFQPGVHLSGTPIICRTLAVDKGKSIHICSDFRVFRIPEPSGTMRL